MARLALPVPPAIPPRPLGALPLTLKPSNFRFNSKIKMMIMFYNNNSIYPALPALSLAGKAQTATPPRRRRPTLSRRELRRLIADMVD